MPRVLDMFASPARSWDASGLRAFRSLLVLHAAVRTYSWLVPGDSWIAGPYSSLAIVLAMRLRLLAAVIASLWPGVARVAAGVTAVVVFVQALLSFPAVADHVYLELFCLVLAVVLDPVSDTDGPLLRTTLCWMAVLVLFHSGLQKVLYGYYFFAEFPLQAVAANDPFGQLFVWMLPSAEVARLRGLNLSLPDTGPFRATVAVQLIASNRRCGGDRGCPRRARRYRQYATERADFGRLTPPPERLGRKLLEEHGATGMVLVGVQTRSINRTTGLIEAGIEKYVYSDRDKVQAELRGGAAER